MTRKWILALFAGLLLIPSAAITVLAQDTCTGDEVTLRLDDWSGGDRVEYMNQVMGCRAA